MRKIFSKSSFFFIVILGKLKLNYFSVKKKKIFSGFCILIYLLILRQKFLSENLENPEEIMLNGIKLAVNSKIFKFSIFDFCIQLTESFHLTPIMPRLRSLWVPMRKLQYPLAARPKQGRT